MSAAEELTLFEAWPEYVEPEHAPEATLDERYEAWIAANPWVLTALAELALDEVRHGATKLGAKALVEILRWHHLRATRSDVFRINNSFVSRLSRDLMARNRSLDGMFETRALRS